MILWLGLCSCILKFGFWIAQQMSVNLEIHVQQFEYIKLFYTNLNVFASGTNRQKKELSVMAVCSASGVTLPGNLTIIPSAQKWVFHAIYQYEFPHLHSSESCSQNRLVFTDEDTFHNTHHLKVLFPIKMFSVNQKWWILPWNLDGIQESHHTKLCKTEKHTNLLWDNVSN